MKVIIRDDGGWFGVRKIVHGSIRYCKVNKLDFNNYGKIKLGLYSVKYYSPMVICAIE